jgi:hypothetical protein
METGLKGLTDYLASVGVTQVAHTHKTYMGHLVAVYRLLEARGCPEDVCRAGMFHSIYGTERFQGFKLPLERRPEVQALIGERAERLAYINCALDRDSLERALVATEEPYRVTDRITGESLALSRADFDDLCRIQLYDWLEQVPRSREWDYRRATYRRLAERLGPTAVEAYDRTFAAEQAATAPPAAASR